LEYLEENFGTAKVNLTPEELLEVRKIIDSIDIAGTRYNTHAMQVRIILFFHLFKKMTLIN
jgi:hypothetical protein